VTAQHRSRDDVPERQFRLAAYFKEERGRTVTLADICANVPGFEATFDHSGTLVKDGRWEAVRKLVRRDLDLLEVAFGIAVEYDEAAHEYRLRPPFFTPEERHLLVTAAALVRVDGIDEGQLAALGAAVDADGQRVVVRVHGHLLALRDAVATRNAVRFRYHGRDRLFEPWAVGLWRDRWYAVGFDRDAGERRVYRLDRIEADGSAPAVTPAGAAQCAIPDGFDPDDALELDPNHWGHDPPLDARVRVDADWAERFRRELGGTTISARDGHELIALTVRHYESFRDRLLGFGTHAQVLEPPVLVDLVREWLAGMAR
jgi:proteasome accessory factor B